MQIAVVGAALRLVDGDVTWHGCNFIAGVKLGAADGAKDVEAEVLGELVVGLKKKRLSVFILVDGLI